jgi:hypothetical protein
MSFTFNDTIPAANNNPSNDQPVMLANNVATNGILAVDHVTFNNAFGGTHKQVTFSSENVPGTAPSDPLSILYTNNITMATATNTVSASTIAQPFFQNQNAIFPISLIRAYGYFDNNGNPLNTYNCSSGPYVGGIGYIVSLASNAVIGTNFGVIVTSNIPTTPYGVVIRTTNAIVMGTTQIVVTFSTPAVSGGATIQSSFSIIVLQL